jgi:hypothetical protein
MSNFNQCVSNYFAIVLLRRFGGKLFVTGTTQGIIEGNGSKINNEDGVLLFVEE